MKSEQIKEITDRATEQLVAALEAGKSEVLTGYLKTIGRFHRYRVHNVLLIALQKPNASYVAGFRTWNHLGRFVKKGERGIMILAPIVNARNRRPSVNWSVTKSRSQAWFASVARTRSRRCSATRGAGMQTTRASCGLKSGSRQRHHAVRIGEVEKWLGRSGRTPPGDNPQRQAARTPEKSLAEDGMRKFCPDVRTECHRSQPRENIFNFLRHIFLSKH
jgi:hypothetical protein